MKSALYARSSSDKQEEAGTIHSQLDAILHNPTVQREEVAEIYADDGVSGYTKPLWERPEGARLMADAEAGRWRRCELLVYRLNRLGRRAREIEEAIDRLLACGVTVYSVKEGYRFDNQTPMGKFTRQLFASLAELDRNTIVETTRDGMVRKARLGELMPTYAYLGYQWSDIDEQGRKKPGAALILNQDEVGLVHLIFEKIQTMTKSALAKWLNENGYWLPCKSPKRREKYGRTERLFDSKALTDILTRELYTGVVSWGKTTNLLGIEPEEFRHYVPELQIVSFETFNIVHEILKERRKVPGKSQGSPYIFSGLLRCPECGGKTVGKRQRHPDYNYELTKRYECRAYHSQGRAACKGWSAYEQTVMKAMVPFLIDLLENKLRVRDFLEESARDMEREQSGEKGQQLQAEIASAKRELTKIQEGYLNEVFTAEEARAKSMEARERIERCENRLKNLEACADVKEELAEALRLLGVPLGAFIEAMPPDQLARLCRAVFDHLSIRASGHGRQRTAEIVSYELATEIKQALADGVHIHSNRPALDVV